MRLLRNRFFLRFLSVFFLLLFTHSLFAPYYALALTSGPHQPEFTSYEDAGSTDMVNLLTGDFNFNVPILNVPGPEGNFSLPLSYHAGIGLGQEASWVGLGWNINAGAIVRNINQYPDDASGEVNKITVQDLTGITGWNRVFNHPFKDDWNSQTGYHGNINLLDIVEVDFGSMNSVGIVGVHVGDGGVTFDPVQFGMAVANIMSLGTSSVGTSAIAIAKQAAIDLAISAATSFVMPVNTPGAGTSGAWNYSSRTTGRSTKYHATASFLTGIPVFSRKKSYKIWLDQTRSEEMYGVLRLGDANRHLGNLYVPYESRVKINSAESTPLKQFVDAAIGRGAASDINFIIDNNVSLYPEQFSPTTLATDSYTVNAPGVSGSISPYRLDIGSVSMPRKMSPAHLRLAPLPYLDNYKVPFIYEGSLSNKYFYHSGGFPTPNSPSFAFGLTVSDYQLNLSSPNQSDFSIELNDPIFEHRIRPDLASIGKVPQGNNIEWFTNADIRPVDGSTLSPPFKFIDFLSAEVPNGIDYKESKRYIFRSNYLSGIGGYTITSADGANYHFAIPIYDYDQVSESISVSDPGKKSKIERTSPFANTWLLTAITGPDFIDRNNNGLADDEDWGYWVKMNYGKYSDSFNWRIPYSGEITDATGHFKSYEQGKKQLYYLNSIETRSHVALFMKSSRQDGISANGLSAPLKLDEICLLKKEQYLKLLQEPYNVSDFSNSISAVCLSLNFVDGPAREYINKNSLKRVKFNYGYDLCKNVPNANSTDNPQKGKLTLLSISVRGRNDLKIAPDTKFEYGTPNPSYDKNAWDGWGMYNANGSSSYSSHKTTDNAGTQGTAWSLSKIITPLGAEIQVNYERDTYSSISGESVYQKNLAFNENISNAATGALNYVVVPTNTFLENEQVKISGSVIYTCLDDQITRTQVIPETIRRISSVQPVDGKYRLTFDQSLLTLQCGSHGPISLNIGGTLSRGAKKGGNIRVASIILTDPNGRTNKQRYLYDETELGSSGVVAQEPDYIKDFHYEFYDYLKYPQTPVVYGSVSVLSGRLASDSDYNSKQIYEFETPHKSQLLIENLDEIPNNNVSDRLYKIKDRSAIIGKLKSVKLYDRNGKLISESQLAYTDEIVNEQGENYQGVFSEGTLLNDFSQEYNGDTQLISIKSTRTTVLTYPYALKKVTSSRDGFLSSSENVRWDLITGAVTEKLDKSSLGVFIKTVIKPAYKFYPEFGSKAYNNNNKNMLLQNAATYVYRSDAMGNTLGLVSADAQTWKKDWNNYRHLVGGNYEDEGLPSSAEQVWRKGPAYVWKGDITRLQQAHGTQNFATSDEFNFNGPVNSNVWQYVGEMKRFDHYGMPLESVDKNGIHASVKMGYDNRTILASASNAKYNEIAFSSAEDKILDEPYFGGEVGLGAGQLVTNVVHTGNTALLLNANQTGFIFKTNELTIGKRYRASVWTNNQAGKIYYKAGSNSSPVVPTGQTISTAVAIPGMGNWYRVDLIIENPAPSITEIGVTTSSNGVVFDDFRFQPADAVMTCYVQQPLNFEFTIPPTQYSPSYGYSLDNDNLFTKVEANEKGEVVKVYAESIRYGVKLLSESKSHYRRTTTDPQ